jgi:hypothetical protein
MNIALSAVIIFILLIPPIAFYLSYSYGRFSKTGPKFTILEGVLATAIISLFVHTAAIYLIPGQIRFDILLKLLGGEIKDVEQKISNTEFNRYIKSFALYNFIILLLFLVLGRIARIVVIGRSLNTERNELLRLNNRWWYLFNGHESDIESFDLLLLDAVVDIKDSTVIYSGFLVNYVCNGEELDRIYLRDVVRRVFRNGEDGKRQTGDPVTIPGETFSISYKSIVNLNLRFLVLEEDIEAIEELPDTGTTGINT